MLLDGLLAALSWLGSEQEKVAHFTLAHRVLRRDLPPLTFRGDDEETVRYFPDKLSIGVDADRRTTVFLYLATQNFLVDFRVFLERHVDVFRRLPAWTGPAARAPTHDRRVGDLPGGVPRAAGCAAQTAGRRRAAVVRRDPARAADRTASTFDLAGRAFRAPRFRAVYRASRERGDRVVEATISATLAKAVAPGTGRFETVRLPHQ